MWPGAGGVRAEEDDKNAVFAKLTAYIDKLTNLSEKPGSQTAVLREEPAELAMPQKEMDVIRAGEDAVIVGQKKERDNCLSGVELALQVLRGYYAADGKSRGAAEDAGSVIIGRLEVCGPDLTQEWTEVVDDERSAKGAYYAETKENEMEAATKGQAVG